MDNRKEFIGFGKTDIVTTALHINTLDSLDSLDSLDFEIIPERKEKFDNVRKKRQCNNFFIHSW